MTQLSRLRLRARQLPPGCLPGAISQQLKQLESLELDTAVELPEEGTAQLSMLSALTRLVVRQFNPAYGMLVPPLLGPLPRLAELHLQSERGVVALHGQAVGQVNMVLRGQRAAVAFSDPNIHGLPRPRLAGLLDKLVPEGISLDRLQVNRLYYDQTEEHVPYSRCQHLRTLRSLSVSGLYARGGADTREAALCALLQPARGLTELRLNHCVDEEDGGWEALCPALAGHTALRKLHLANNSFYTTRGAPFLLCVEHLDLTCCSLQHFPASAVLSAPLLRTLSLAGNTDLVLTAEDVQTLEMISFLQVLDLRGVQIHPTEAIQLARSLPHVQLVLDSAAQHWDHGGYHGMSSGQTGVEWGEWPAAEDGQQ